MCHEKMSFMNGTCSTPEYNSRDLRIKGQSCEYGQLLESLIRDRVVVGILTQR